MYRTRVCIGSCEVIPLLWPCCYSYSFVLTWLCIAVVQLFSTYPISAAAVTGWADSWGSTVSVPHQARKQRTYGILLCVMALHLPRTVVVEQKEGRQGAWWWVFHGRMRKMLGCLGILKWIHGAAIPMNHLCVLNIFKAVFPACFQKKKLILHPPSTWVIHTQSGGNMCVHYSFDLLRSIEEVKPQGWTRTP